jgi:hypothetical protein
MARVIINKQETEFTVLCNHCKSLIGYYKSEVKKAYPDISLPGPELQFRYIICPKCNETILFL